MPGPSCQTCSHPALREIDAAFLAGKSAKSIATTYGLDYSSARRHRSKGHVAQPVAQEKPARASEISSDSSLAKLLAMIEDLEGRETEAMGTSAFVDWINARRAAYKDLAALQGPTAPLKVDLSITEEWITLREFIYAALLAVPGAVEALNAAIKRWEEAQ
jgi:hypothetical protein